MQLLHQGTSSRTEQQWTNSAPLSPGTVVVSLLVYINLVSHCMGALWHRRDAACFPVLLQLSALKSFIKCDVTSAVPPFLDEEPTAMLLLMLL